MSGDTAYLRAPSGSFFARAFAQLAGVPVEPVPWALVGGLAVGARLAVAHRATTDVDAVSTRRDDLIELLVRSGGVKTRGMVKFGGIPIEPLAIPGKGAGRLPDARSWAFDGATRMRIVVCDEDGKELADATAAVATAAGLVLLKLESSVHATVRSAAKRAIDIYDVLRLFAPAAGLIAADVAAAPRQLRADAAQCARDRLVRKPAETIKHFSDAQRQEFSVDDMRFYGEALVRLLSP